MAYEQKVPDALSKIIDTIFYEEGRLAVINKYGSFLNDMEKAQATDLITKQRAELDRLFDIYKKELEPIVMSVLARGESMAPLVNKLLSSQAMGQVADNQMMTANDFDNTVHEAETSEVAPAENVETQNSDFDVSADMINNEDENASEIGIVNDTVQAPSVGEITEPMDSSDGMMAGDTEQNDGFFIDSMQEMAQVVSGLGIDDMALQESEAGNDVMQAISTELENASPAVPVESSVISDFVLSPMDEGIAPAPAVNETKVEEQIESSEQQLQAINDMKTDIVSSDLPAGEKVSELERYIRMTDGAVKAILVTKTQLEKLLSSRVKQKESFTGQQAAAVINVEQGSTPDVVSIDGMISNDSLFPQPVDDVTGSDDNLEQTEEAVSEQTDSSPIEQSFLPSVEGESSDNGTSGDGLENSEASSQQNELQTMIEQANELYKAGKTAEAQALFDKVGAINKEIQDASVLVKK